jgi:hypothetical protein
MRLIEILNPFTLFQRRDRILPFLDRNIKLVHLCMNKASIPVTINDWRLRSLENKHQGQRAFIIGNGPSLKIEDLNRLNNEITFASNKIYLVFGNTNWQPTYYVVCDYLVAENNRATILQLDLFKIFSEAQKPILGKAAKRKLFYRELGDGFGPNDEYHGAFSKDALIGIQASETVTTTHVQLAYYMGCNPIYLIGLDGKYVIPQTMMDHPVYNRVLVSQGEGNHFVENYHAPGETWAVPRPEHHEIGYRYARQVIEQRGGTILNASRVSFVKAFERINFDSLF